MKRDILRFIKNDMWEVRHCKKDVQAQLKEALNELEARRKEALAEYAGLPEDDWYRAYAFRTTNERYDRERTEVVSRVYNQWHNDQSYHLIYKDGSVVCIHADEILSGEPFPKMSDIVYAEMSSADDHMDTETGDLHWYSDERMEACGWNYDAEDEAVWQYETAIQFKFGTEWSKRWSRLHPDFVPVEI